MRSSSLIQDRAGLVHSRSDARCVNYPDDRRGVTRSPPRKTRAFVSCLYCLTEDKIAKIAKYREQGIVAATEPVIIALNQGAILDSDLNDLELPLALYGVGGTG
jgi:hypothetical protein